MKLKLLHVCAVLVLQPAFAGEANISRDHAHHLAAAYFAHYVSGCGGVEAPLLRGDYWEAPVRFGVAGTPSGFIRVHSRTGMVSYSWHAAWHSGPWPTIAANDLDAWPHSPKKRSHVP